MTKKKAENSKKAAKKVVGTPFKKGTSGNPAGRPRKLKELTIACQDMTEIILKQLRRCILEGEPKDITAAAKIVLAYGYGSAPQTITVEGEITHQYVNAPLGELDRTAWLAEYNKTAEELH